MRFRDCEYKLLTDEIVVIVRVKADLIRLFWDVESGPQDEAGIVDEDRRSIDIIASVKLRAGESVCGVVEVSTTDWEAGDDGTPFDGDEAGAIYD